MGKWKKEAERLRLQVQEYQRFEASMHEHLSMVSANMDRLWEAVGEEPGDRNEHGVRSLAVVLERRMTELQEWRQGWRSPEPSVFGPMIPEPEERVCSGYGYLARIGWGNTDDATPCATMTGCWGRAWRGIVWPERPPGHTHPCGVLS